MEATRKYTITLYGATGFTGQKVLKLLVEKISKLNSLNSTNFTLAVSGRNETRLKQLVDEVKTESLDIGVVLADNEIEPSLVAMAKDSDVVINCTGPYRYYGENVVKACAQNGTHYLDITGEPEFMETMELKYHDVAKKNGCFIISACGFDSIPGDLGTVFATKQFSNGKPEVVPYYVEQILRVYNLKKFHFTTYESAVLGVGLSGNLRNIRKQLGSRSIPNVNGFKPPKVGNKVVDGTNLVPFPGADASVVKRTQFSLSQLNDPNVKAVKHACYVDIGGTKNKILMNIFGAMFMILAKSSFGRSLLLKFPGFFTNGLASRKGPTQKELDAVHFEFETNVVGTKGANGTQPGQVDKELKVLVRGPEPGYVATPICVVDATLTLIEELDKMRSFLKTEGGVYTPGAAFYETTLVERLTEDGVTFEVV